MAPKTKKIVPKPKAGYEVYLKPTSWRLNNRVSFGKWFNQVFSKTSLLVDQVDLKDTCPLFDYQQLIKSFLQYDSPYRGMIVYHGLGTGKTRTSISIAEVLSTNMDIEILLPASIEQNYINEILRCGNTYYTYQKHWKFLSNKELLGDENSNESLKIPDTSLKKLKGAWISVPNLSPNFDTLGAKEKNDIMYQVQESIKQRYNFLHYNGLTETFMKTMKTDYFENKVVIIDEVHNFISRVVNAKGVTIPVRLFQRLMTTTNVKLLLLSGTPIINKPVEISYLVNLVHGYQYIANLKYAPRKNIDVDQLTKFLDKDKSVDYFKIDHGSRQAQVAFAPPGFIMQSKGKEAAVKREGPIEPIDKRMKALIKTLNEAGFAFSESGSTLSKFNMLPLKQEEFDNLFIDYQNLDSPIKNVNLLSRRLQGIISYFESYDPKMYPKSSGIKIVNVNMGKKHLEKYDTIRTTEQDQERRAARKRARNAHDPVLGNVYRAFSRAVCNYYFDDSLQRVYPSNIRRMMKEMDVQQEYASDGEDEDIAEENSDEDKPSIVKDSKPVKETKKIASKATASDLDTAYEKSKKATMAKLWKERAKFLQGEKLKDFSPKYYEIIENIKKSPGPVLIYSQFRDVEGLGVLQLALAANGFAEFKLDKNLSVKSKTEDIEKPKYIVFGSDGKDMDKVYLDIFNGDIENYPKTLESLAQLNEVDQTNILQKKNMHGEIAKVFMITQSGAEGISLKNVRQVHIVEPFWNEIRIKQVIGRAIRAGSHLSLPERERQVDVFMYMMQFKKDGMPPSGRQDDGKTSDEHIWSLAQRKAKIVNTLLNIVKSVAVDCELHIDNHRDNGVKCYKPISNFGGPDGLMFKYEPIDQDINDHTLAKMLKPRRSTEKKDADKINKKENGDKENNEIDQDHKPKLVGFIKNSAGNRFPYYTSTLEILDPVLFLEGTHEVIGFIKVEDGKARVHVRKDRWYKQPVE